MKNALLSELFGGAHRLALLQVLYINPTREFTATEAATLAKVDPGNTLRWLKKWADVGLVERTQVGRNISYHASNDPLLAGLTDILRRNDEVVTDIASALPDEAEIAVVFGSVARGEEKATSDIDVLVLGDELSELRVNALLRPVGRKHSREIHASVFSRKEFEQMLADGNDFARNVVSQKVIPLKGVFAYANSNAASTGAG